MGEYFSFVSKGSGLWQYTVQEIEMITLSYTDGQMHPSHNHAALIFIINQLSDLSVLSISYPLNRSQLGTTSSDCMWCSPCRSLRTGIAFCEIVTFSKTRNEQILVSIRWFDIHSPICCKSPSSQWWALKALAK